MMDLRMLLLGEEDEVLISLEEPEPSFRSLGSLDGMLGKSGR